MSVPRTRPQLGQLGNRYAVVTAGSTCAEWQPVNPDRPAQGSNSSAAVPPTSIFLTFEGASSINPAQAFLGLLPQQDGGSCSFQHVTFSLPIAY